MKTLSFFSKDIKVLLVSSNVNVQPILLWILFYFHNERKLLFSLKQEKCEDRRCFLLYKTQEKNI